MHPVLAITRRSGIADSLRLIGFSLLLITTLLYSKFPLPTQSEVIWLGFLAAYSFYFLNAFESVKVKLIG